MAFDLASITKEKRHRAPRIILLGTEKVGKSTFASQAPDPAFVTVEGEQGVDDLEVFKWPQPAETFDSVLECLAALYDHECKTVVIDSVSALEPIIWNVVRRRCPDKDGNIPQSIEQVGGGFQKGYTEALNEWGQLTAVLDFLRNDKDKIIILIGHIKVKRFDDPLGQSYDQYQWDINEKAASKLFRWADSILFANWKTTVRKEDVGFGKEKAKGVDLGAGCRYLFTQKRASHPGGGRGVYGRLSYELPLSWNAFQQAIFSVFQLDKEGECI